MCCFGGTLRLKFCFGHHHVHVPRMMLRAGACTNCACCDWAVGMWIWGVDPSRPTSLLPDPRWVFFVFFCADLFFGALLLLLLKRMMLTECVKVTTVGDGIGISEMLFTFSDVVLVVV
eukprot:RCo038426